MPASRSAAQAGALAERADLAAVAPLAEADWQVRVRPAAGQAVVRAGAQAAARQAEAVVVAVLAAGAAPAVLADWAADRAAAAARSEERRASPADPRVPEPARAALRRRERLFATCVSS